MEVKNWVRYSGKIGQNPFLKRYRGTLSFLRGNMNVVEAKEKASDYRLKITLFLQPHSSSKTQKGLTLTLQEK